MRLAAAVLLLLATGCAAAPPKAEAPKLATEIIWCKSEPGMHRWTDQAVAKFNNPIVLFCHGDDSAQGRWQLVPDGGPLLDATTVAWTLRNVFHRDVVLVACNAGGATVPVDRVWYAPHSIVWKSPGMEWGFIDDKYVQGVGDVSGLVEGGN